MKIGFIGLGIMGKPMCRNLLKAGHEVLAYDIVPAALDEAVSFGAARAASLAEVAQGCPLIITMLPNGPDVKAVLLGEDGVLAHIRPGALIVDMSSIAPGISMECEKAARAAGARMMDAPVSGGQPKAVDGTLAIMAGADPADFDEAYPVLLQMGATAVLTGPVGSGNVTKLCNQIIVAVNIAAMGEALTLAAKAGVNPELVYRAIRGGLAGSTVLDAKAPKVLDRDFAPGFRIDLHIKDLHNALDTARALDCSAELSQRVLAMMESLSAGGEGGSDHCAVARWYERRADAEIRRPEEQP